MNYVKLLVILLFVAGCSDQPVATPGSQGSTVAEGIPSGQFDSVMDPKIAMYLKRGALSNTDEELRHNPTPERASTLRSFREATLNSMCDYWNQIREKNIDVIQNDWAREFKCEKK